MSLSAVASYDPNASASVLAAASAYDNSFDPQASDPAMAAFNSGYEAEYDEPHADVDASAAGAVDEADKRVFHSDSISSAGSVGHNWRVGDRCLAQWADGHWYYTTRVF